MYRSTSQVIVETNMAETAIKRTARADPAPIPGKADTTGRMRDAVSPVAAQELAATENSLLANDNPASVCGMLAARRNSGHISHSPMYRDRIKLQTETGLAGSVVGSDRQFGVAFVR